MSWVTIWKRRKCLHGEWTNQSSGRRSGVRHQAPSKRHSTNSQHPSSTSTAIENLKPQFALRTPAALLAAFLLALFATLSYWEMKGDSFTIDERVYLPVGYAYWTERDFRLNPEHPPFAKLWGALALLPMHLTLPPVPHTQHPADDQMVFGSALLFGANADEILFRGRLPMLVLGILLAAFVFWWSRELHGAAGPGLLSLLLIVFEPTTLAHSHYVATDVPLACFSVMAMFFLWRFAERGGGMANLVLAALGLALALGSKFTAVFLAPVFFALLLIRWPTERNRRDARGLRARFVALVAIVILVAAIVQGFYFFSPDLTLYFKGLQRVNAYSIPQAVLPYINGRFVPGGAWWYWFYVLALKLPLATLILIIIAAVALFRRKISKTDMMYVLLPAGVYLAATCALANNLGIRYLIPVIAFLLVFTGRAWFVLTPCRAGKLAATVLAGWLVVSVLRISPHYISYFNESIGGAENAAYYLDDSNVDWGQDLLRLMRYFQRKEINEAVLSYWGPAPPDYDGERFGVRVKPWTNTIATEPDPGVYAISVNDLTGVLREMAAGRRPFDSRMDWLHLYRPVGRVGYSIYIYKFPARPRLN
jgi:4-amino-4-deoxy-L-arabinose transferase-like glycosyltransferase